MLGIWLLIYGINLEDLFDLDQKPEELLCIFISEQRDDLFFLLDGDLMEINTLCAEKQRKNEERI